MIQDSCLLRKLTLPLLPCDENDCEWFVNEAHYNNCFWVLAEIFDDVPNGLSLAEIAKLEGISIEEVKLLLEQAVLKYRANIRRYLREV